jgi:hypothetical protein
MLERGAERVPIPDTGALRTDLLEYGKSIVASISGPDIRSAIRALTAAGDGDPGLADAVHRFWRTRIELAGRMVERAISRGELAPGTDPGAVVEGILAPIYFRLLMSGEPLDTAFLERVAAAAAAGSLRASGR